MNCRTGSSLPLAHVAVEPMATNAPRPSLWEKEKRACPRCGSDAYEEHDLGEGMTSGDCANCGHSSIG